MPVDHNRLPMMMTTDDDDENRTEDDNQATAIEIEKADGEKSLTKESGKHEELSIVMENSKPEQEVVTDTDKPYVFQDCI